MNAKGYSLWFIPSGVNYGLLKQGIGMLSRTFKSPVFEPHITLLGKIEESEKEVVRKVSVLASRINTFEVELNNVGYGDDCFQRLFYLTNKPKELMDANKEARNIFGRQSDELYLPHLSMLYSSGPVNAHDVICGMSNLVLARFPVKKLVLMNANGKPEDWKPIKDFNL